MTRTRDGAGAGALIARFLAGSWRTPPPTAPCSAAELEAIAPLLLKSGAGALAWYRIRGSALEETVAASRLRDAYRAHMLEAEVHAYRITEVLERLRRAALEPLLVKGWAIARAYPEAGLRPYSDIDIVVPPGRGPAARAALADGPPLRVPVDVHDGPALVDLASFEALRARAEAIPLRRTQVWVPGPEDHLRMLALHALRHGVFRPLWLVDLAVAIETRPAGFDWARCLGPDRRRAEWVLGALGLAHRLLGASVAGTPAAGAPDRLPGWLVAAVLRSWNRCEGESHRPRAVATMLSLLGRPRELRVEMRRRWDRPIQATLDVRGPFNRLPRFPFQVAAALLRIPEVVRTVREGAAARPPGH